MKSIHTYQKGAQTFDIALVSVPPIHDNPAPTPFLTLPHPELDGAALAALPREYTQLHIGVETNP